MGSRSPILTNDDSSTILRIPPSSRPTSHSTKLPNLLNKSVVIPSSSKGERGILSHSSSNIDNSNNSVKNQLLHVHVRGSSDSPEGLVQMHSTSEYFGRTQTQQQQLQQQKPEVIANNILMESWNPQTRTEYDEMPTSTHRRASKTNNNIYANLNINTEITNIYQQSATTASAQTLPIRNIVKRKASIYSNSSGKDHLNDQIITTNNISYPVFSKAIGADEDSLTNNTSSHNNNINTSNQNNISSSATTAAVSSNATMITLPNPKKSSTISSNNTTKSLNISTINSSNIGNSHILTMSSSNHNTNNNLSVLEEFNQQQQQQQQQQQLQQSSSNTPRILLKPRQLTQNHTHQVPLTSRPHVKPQTSAVIDFSFDEHEQLQQNQQHSQAAGQQSHMPHYQLGLKRSEVNGINRMSPQSKTNSSNVQSGRHQRFNADLSSPPRDISIKKLPHIKPSYINSNNVSYNGNNINNYYHPIPSKNASSMSLHHQNVSIEQSAGKFDAGFLVAENKRIFKVKERKLQQNQVMQSNQPSSGSIYSHSDLEAQHFSRNQQQQQQQISDKKGSYSNVNQNGRSNKVEQELFNQRVIRHQFENRIHQITASPASSSSIAGTKHQSPIKQQHVSNSIPAAATATPGTMKGTTVDENPLLIFDKIDSILQKSSAAYEFNNKQNLEKDLLKLYNIETLATQKANKLMHEDQSTALLHFQSQQRHHNHTAASLVKNKQTDHTLDRREHPPTLHGSPTVSQKQIKPHHNSSLDRQPMYYSQRKEIVAKSIRKDKGGNGVVATGTTATIQETNSSERKPSKSLHVKAPPRQRYSPNDDDDHEEVISPSSIATTTDKKNRKNKQSKHSDQEDDADEREWEEKPQESSNSNNALNNPDDPTRISMMNQRKECEINETPVKDRKVNSLIPILNSTQSKNGGTEETIHHNRFDEKSCWEIYKVGENKNLYVSQSTLADEMRRVDELQTKNDKAISAYIRVRKGIIQLETDEKIKQINARSAKEAQKQKEHSQQPNTFESIPE